MRRIPTRVVKRLGAARAAKLAGAVGLLLLFFMAAVPLASGIRTERAIDSFRDAGRDIVTLDRLHREIADQQAVLQGGRSAQPVVTAGEFERMSDAATLSLRNDVPTLPGSAPPRARALRTQEGLRVQGKAVTRALVFGRNREARALYSRLASPEGVLHGSLDEVELLAVKRADRRAGELESTNETTMMMVPVALGVGMLVLILLWSVRLEVRRRETTTEAEVALLSRQLLTDSLTGLPNERALAEALDQDLLEDGDHDGVGLVLFDLDDLKRVNNTRGHHAGDDRLKRVATCLTSALTVGTLYRVGGDKFAIRLPGVGAWEAFEVAQKLQDSLPREPGSVSITAGVAEAPAGAPRDLLLHRADVAVIAAKGSRRTALLYAPDLEPSLHDDETEANRRHVETLATALARAVDAKDSYTRSHSETVSALCGLVGEELGFPPERLGALRLAGLLHDVGKIGISDDILQKPAKLTDPEYEVMKTHSTIGHRIVMGAALEEHAHRVLHHHERPDGRGYPDGLVGEQIPLESRIILVADAFEAMISDRPYRPGRPEAQALAELDRYSGTQFDSDCVTALRRVLAGGGIQAVGLEDAELEAA